MRPWCEGRACGPGHSAWKGPEGRAPHVLELAKGPPASLGDGGRVTGAVQAVTGRRQRRSLGCATLVQVHKTAF